MRNRFIVLAAITLVLSSFISFSLPAQIVTTVAGSVTGDADGVGAAAQFNGLRGIVYGSGNLYTAEYNNNKIRKVVLSTAAASTIAGSTIGYADGTGTAAQFTSPGGIALDNQGNAYIADEGNNIIRKVVLATGEVSTFAGNVTGGFSDGVGTAASFFNPVFITYDGADNLYVSDRNNEKIRKIVIATAEVTTVAGSTNGFADGTGSSAQFNQPCGLATDGQGNLYVADLGNNCIRKIVLSTGQVTTIAGNGTGGFADGTGSVARFSLPLGIVYDGRGALYVADLNNHSVRKVLLSTTQVTTIAGSTTAGNADGTGPAAQFTTPTGITFDGAGNLYIADEGSNLIRKIELTDFLPVSFGTISASLGGNQLQVDFSTLSEANNDYFLIEASKDGEVFTSLGHLKSQAKDGNSDLSLHYTFLLNTIGAGLMSVLGFGIFATLIAIPRRNRSVLAVLAVVAIISLCSLLSCSKTGANDVEANEKLYIRIAQVDKDGSKSYSKVITVQRK